MDNGRGDLKSRTRFSKTGNTKIDLMYTNLAKLVANIPNWIGNELEDRSMSHLPDLPLIKNQESATTLVLCPN